MGIIEFLNDPKPSRLVCKFAVPFINVVLYQRMLIEQKNDIHLNIARCLMHHTFSYMDLSDEIRVLNMHLKITEKSIINYLEEDDEDKEKEKESFNLNNLKIFYVKELTQKLKALDYRLDTIDDTDTNNRSYPYQLKRGTILMKMDRGNYWEEYLNST